MSHPKRRRSVRPSKRAAGRTPGERHKARQRGAARTSMRRLTGGAVGAVLIGIVGYWALTQRFGSGGRRLEQATAALQRGDHVEALRLAEAELRQHPRTTEALLVAAYAAAGQHHVDTALGYFEQIPEAQRRTATQALQSLAISEKNSGWATPAERYFELALQWDPAHQPTRAEWIQLLIMENRIWEAQQQILKLFQQGHFDINHLIVAVSRDVWLADVSEFSQRCLQAAPQDPLPRLPDADAMWRDNRRAEAIALYRLIVATHPKNVEAQARLGRALVDQAPLDEVWQWQQQLPPQAEQHPLVWLTRGLAAERMQQPSAAVRCFGEAVLRDPRDAVANYQLAQSLAALGTETQAEVFAQRSRQLEKLEQLVNAIRSQKKTTELRQVVDLLESQGRAWEAVGWCHAALSLSAPPDWAAPTAQRLRGELPSRSYTLESHALAQQIDLSQYPLPDWTSAKDASPSLEQDTGPASVPRTVSFRDVAAVAGVEFTYFNGGSDDQWESMFELNGGGVAVLDYDNDGWPDLYFTQGGPRPPHRQDHAYQDRLFRNLGNGRFEDVTQQTGLGDKGYGQGVTVGDYDGDGFPDLYVANIGANRFYRNNTDGTFRDVTAHTGTATDAWSSSCVLADLNGDTLPDLYVVNYLSGAELYELCDKRGPSRCAPLDYLPAQDRLYLNLGDGRFADVTDRSGVVAADGRGLGVVVANLSPLDFASSATGSAVSLSMFVANDMGPNFMFTPATGADDDEVRFVEHGVLSGVGFDDHGNAQACMGVAVGDADEDGALDLFVTNFYGEANNFFVQRSAEIFQDRARQANLYDAGFQMLGWGTQYIDGDLDGRLDLVVANGHVHQPTDPSVPWRMAPQYFHNLGEGRFAQPPADTLGEYFRGRYLGRGLARLDWNRDGREDFCVTHLDTPVALLTNQTPQAGHFVGLRLIGVASDREAIGGTAELTAGGQASIRQLTAGDGFQACNQRQLVFGLGEATTVTRLQIHWPSGRRQTFNDVGIDQYWTAVEGQSELFASGL